MMAKRPFTTNIRGRVKKVKTNDFLVALFEAVSNSIHAIADRWPSGSGEIEVEILRQPRQTEADFASAPDGDRPITGFIITDNGIGFHDENMDSFCEADSLLKAKLGGKGVGRFTWLKFFEGAQIESIYSIGGKRYRRVFAFSTRGIDSETVNETESEPWTRIRISPVIIDLERTTRKSLDDVTIEVVEHFITYLITGAMPTFRIRDGAGARDVIAFYQESVGKNTSKRRFALNGNMFETTALRFYLGEAANVLLLCADKRVAEKFNLGRHDPFFARRFSDNDLKKYSFQMFVQSEYLDKIANDDREGFSFPEPLSLLAATAGAVTKEELVSELLRISHAEMEEEIQKIRTTNVDTVSSFVRTDAPQYRYLIAKKSKEISSIHETDKVRLDQTLRRLQFEEELNTREEIAALLTRDVTGSARDEWKVKSAEVLAKLNEEGKANLASYIVQRRLILELLRKRMQVTDGAYAREEAVHQLIFPMRTTSDEVSYEDQNLWIVDERLSYHYYLASDKALNSMPPADTGSRREPDIVVFNRPIALNDRPENERLESIVIIEFKRPGESSVEGNKNPVDQILEYIEHIREGRATTRSGRPIQKSESMYFFGYVIAELDPLLRRVLVRRTMQETPDSRGMFGFFPAHRAYIEVISYDKMLDDAQKRNRILFEKLQIPSGKLTR